MDFLQSEKGKHKIAYKGYIYLRERKVKETEYWKCELYFKNKCNARLVISGKENIREKGDHNHPGNAVKVEVSKIVTSIRERAMNTMEVPQVIISNSCSTVTRTISGELPRIDSLRRTIRNVRARLSKAPAVPNSASDLVIPENFQKTDRNENFILYDSECQDDRIIIFGTENNRKLLENSTLWYMDGTFKTVPRIFQQLYTVHVQHKDLVAPVLYCLLPAKDEKTYVNLLEKVKNMVPEAKLKYVITDYEKAMCNAIKTVFPSTQHKGCYFHFAQCIYRNVQQRGLKQRYDTDAEFAHNIKMLMALAFVPKMNVIELFDEVVEKNEMLRENPEFLNYFEDTWIGRPVRGNRRRPPMFSIDMWNCNDLMTEGISTTNNAVEGWHRGFLSQLTANHPSIWMFINAIKREQTMTNLKLAEMDCGKSKRKKYSDRNERILGIVRNFENGIDVLDLVASNLY